MVASFRGRVKPVNENQLSSVPCRLVSQHSAEFSPIDFRDAFGEFMVSHHSLDVEVFHHDDLVFVNQMVCYVMEEVQFSVPYLLVQFGEAEPRLLSVLASDNLLGNLTLKPFQSALLIFLEVDVLNHLTVRGDGKVLDSQIKSYHVL